MILVQPDKLQIIRANPIYREPIIILEQLNEQYGIEKELAEAPEGYSVPQSFSYFANEGLIEPKGWKEINKDLRGTQNIRTLIDEAKQSNNLYYGNAR